jgi:sugar/nucleoside kinase (ribokinase family)
MDSTHTPQVIVLGDVITDIIARQTEDFISAADTRTKIDIRAGGSAANLAAWLATTGLKVHFVGRVGRDPFGFFHQEELGKLGIVPHLSFDSQHSTGSSVILVDHATGERHMLTDRGANQYLSPEDIPWKLFSRENCFHLSGYSLLEGSSREVALQMLEKARQVGMKISVDPSATSLLREIGPQQFLNWTKGAQLCFPNLEEGQLLSGEASPEAVARFLAEWYGEVALKRGREGSIWLKKGQPAIFMPSLPVKVVDSTGAGDAFAAGFLAEWLKGAPALEDLAAGTRLGAKVAAQPGARPI